MDAAKKRVPVYLLSPDDVAFPPADHADADGLLAVGGDLRPERLLTAYRGGIFPWYGRGLPILWHSPDPRYVLDPAAIHVSRSLRRTINRKKFDVRYDTAFEQVVDSCARAPRPGQKGTWITPEMKSAYLALHHMGHAHSVESWASGELKGGLYGVALGAIFFGESMFARAPDASKVALVHLAQRLSEWGFRLIDCQMETAHLARFGAQAWPRKRFLAALKEALEAPARMGRWP